MARKKADAEPTAEAALATTEKVSKADAVRAALSEGADTPPEGIAFIKAKFGIDITPAHFSSYKSQEKARLAKKAAGGVPARRGRAPKGAPATVAVVAPSPSSNGPAGLAIQVEAIKSLVDMLGVDQVVSIARLFGK